LPQTTCFNLIGRTNSNSVAVVTVVCSAERPAWLRQQVQESSDD